MNVRNAQAIDSGLSAPNRVRYHGSRPSGVSVGRWLASTEGLRRVRNMASSQITEKVEFDDFKADDELVRTVFLKRLKNELAGWSELGLDGWEGYVEFSPGSYPTQLLLRAMRVYWQLVNEGI